jgi:hypothetical protein
MAQMQLLKMPLDRGDVVYTPDWVARDMVDFFKPTGRILEPCKGDGAFLKYLPPQTEWCEITEGRDFFAWTEPVDWIVGNPPYKQFRKFLGYSYQLAKDIVFFIPIDKPFNSLPSLTVWQSFGGIVSMRVYGRPGEVGFEVHRPMAAFQFRRGYTGPMYTTFAERVEFTQEQARSARKGK